jgi:hypothetical protein
MDIDSTKSRIKRNDPDVHCTDCGKDLKHNGCSGNITGHTKHKGWELVSGCSRHMCCREVDDIHLSAPQQHRAPCLERHDSYSQCISKVPTRRKICSLLDDLEVTARAGLLKELRDLEPLYEMGCFRTKIKTSNQCHLFVFANTWCRYLYSSTSRAVVAQTSLVQGSKRDFISAFLNYRPMYVITLKFCEM